MTLEKKLELINNYIIRNKRTILFLLSIAWIVIVAVLSGKREPWRDEVRALSIAIEAKNITELPELLKNEGHPILWYAILHTFHQNFESPIILKFSSILIASAAILIFLFYSPFNLGIKTLFIFGGLPLYEYSVVARNYGLGMLLLFLFAVVYSHKKFKPMLLGLILALLANTSAHALIISVFLLLIYTYNLFIQKRRYAQKINIQNTIIIPLAIALTGITLAVLTILPTEESKVLHNHSTSTIIRVFVKSFWHIGDVFTTTLFSNTYLSLLFIIALSAGLIKKPLYSLSVLGLTYVFYIFDVLIYSSNYRHLGLFIIFTIILYWISYEKKCKRNNLEIWFKLSVYLLLPLLLLKQLEIGQRKIRMDWNFSVTSAKPFSDFIKSENKLKNAVIICEPDSYIESLPYYLNNRLYLVREKRYRNYSSFTTINNKRITLSEILQCANRINRKTEQPVIILLQLFNLEDIEHGNTIAFGYGNKLSWSVDDLKKFRASTRKLREFKGSLTKEDYCAYLLIKPKHDSSTVTKDFIWVDKPYVQH